MAAGAGGLWAMGEWITQRAKGILRQGLSFGHAEAFDSEAMTAAFSTLSSEALMMTAPFFLLTIVAAFLPSFLMGNGWNFSTKALGFKASRMSPLSGIKRMFSWQSIMELTKAVLKALLIGGVIWWVVRHEQDQLFALIAQPYEVALDSFGRILLFAILGLVAGLSLIALIDVPFQIWQYHEKLKMTKEEVRQEYKEMEGSPELKARIRRQQREIARNRMMSEVPKADVIVTNPTHFAVALKYDSRNMAAPQVVAKGMNLIAQKIREIAEENQVPILEAPPLARALYRHAEIGDQIPAPLYTAVAEVMAYVYQLNQFIATGGKLLPPVAPSEIKVPDGLDPGPVAEGGVA